MKAKFGKVYEDGSQDLIIEQMSEEMKETLLRLGMIKAVEEAVKNNADWLREAEADKGCDSEAEYDPTCWGCDGTGIGWWPGSNCRHCGGTGREKGERD